MAVRLIKSKDFTRQKKLALCMWYDIIITLQHEIMPKIGIQKYEFAVKHNLCWPNNCFLCHLFMKSVTHKDELGIHIDMSCTKCPLERKYKGQVSYGCSSEGHITAYARVIDFYLPKEERIAAAWEIIEAIKSV